MVVIRHETPGKNLQLVDPGNVRYCLQPFLYLNFVVKNRFPASYAAVDVIHPARYEYAFSPGHGISSLAWTGYIKFYTNRGDSLRLTDFPMANFVSFVTRGTRTTLFETAKLSEVNPHAFVLEAANRAIREPGTVTLPADLT